MKSRATRERHPTYRRRRSARSGKALALVAVCLPATLATLALSIDAGMLMIGRQDSRHAADSAATAAAMELQLGESVEEARERALEYACLYDGVEAENVRVEIPPIAGPNAGRSGFVEVTVEIPSRRSLLRMFAVGATPSSASRAVAGSRASTTPSALTVLDESPEPTKVLGVPLIFGGLPQLLGGLEVLGAGDLNVDGSVLVNTSFGGRDEQGDWVGESVLPPYAINCTPLLPLTRVRARDVRVAGGVDDPDNFAPFVGSESPLDANRLPVPDPFRGLPVPTVSSDPSNVRTTTFGHVSVAGLPIGPERILTPGIYDSLAIISGRVRLEPGVYVVRGKNPLTQVSLLIGAATVDARGVLFYITDSAAYDAVSGSPDVSDGETSPADPHLPSLLPSVVIQGLLPGSRLEGLDDAGSPFDGMLLYQRRHDRRAIILAGVAALNSDWLAGKVYAKWGHVNFAGQGEYDLAVAAGTVRIETLLALTLRPRSPLAPAHDVYLVE